MGYRFQFVTLAGFHTLKHSMFDLANGYREQGMAAYSDLQEREFASEERGYTAMHTSARSAPATSRRSRRRSPAGRSERPRCPARRRSRSSRAEGAPLRRLRHLRRLAHERRRGGGGARVAGEAVADAWRARYQPQLETVRSGEREWVVLDILHREALDDVLAELELDLAPDQRDELTLAWHRLDPWPDTVAGLTRLKERFVIAPCSNGHIAQSVNLAKHAGLPWDAILGAEIARAYKPDPRVYEASVAALGLLPDEAMMVAAHGGDLQAAAACGLRTAFVPRPNEYPGAETDAAADVSAPGFEALAAALLGAKPGSLLPSGG